MGDLQFIDTPGMSPYRIQDGEGNLVAGIKRFHPTEDTLRLARCVPVAVRAVECLEAIITAYDGREGSLSDEIDKGRDILATAEKRTWRERRRAAAECAAPTKLGLDALSKRGDG